MYRGEAAAAREIAHAGRGPDLADRQRFTAAVLDLALALLDRTAQREQPLAALGQDALVDTRTDTIMGQVIRIDPAAQDGVVVVDVALPPNLPRSARPGLAVEGIIELERLENVLYVGRPAYGQAHSTVGLFKLVDGGGYAERVNVRLGRSSVNTIEIQEGLRIGDVVILVDMSQWDAYDRVRMR